MKNKIISVLLATAMMSTMLFGCGQSQTNEEVKTSESVVTNSEEKSEEKTEEKTEEITVDYFAGTELTIAICAKPNDQSRDFNDKPIFKRMEEETGIHINWITVDEAIKDEAKIGLRKYFSILTAKRYTEDDKIVLTERNFEKY